MSAFQIRLTEKLTCSKDVLYSARREEIRKLKESEMDDLMREIQGWHNWENEVRTLDKKLESLYFFHIPVMSTPYARDIAVIDDTSCTNFYGLPLLVIIAVDENFRSQVMSFSVLPGRRTEDFVAYLTAVKNRVGIIRLFVCDRNKTQIRAIRQVFPEAKIIYCAIHIGRNLKQKVGKEMQILYKKMRRSVIGEDEFLEVCEDHIRSNPGAKSSKLLTGLLTEREHWLPSITGQYTHCDNETSNRVEGFFGTLKKLIDHKTQTLARLVRAVYLRSERMLLTSLNDRQMSLPDDLMSDDDVAQVGNYALAMCLSEYMDLHDKGVLTNEYSATCCNNHAMFDLPCRHLLLQRMKEDCCPLLSIDDIPQRWRRSIQIEERSPNTVERVALTKNDNDQEWSYSACVAKFERYFSNARRSEKVRMVLNDALDILHSVEHAAGSDADDLLPPDNMLLPGAHEVHPRRHVDLPGAKRTRKKYKCSLCGNTDHTAPRCPKSLNKS